MNNLPFKTVGVMMGGPSAEHDVSLKSGLAVAIGLREAGFLVHEIVLDTEDFDIPADVEAVFPALHGVFGEDGGVQRVLETRCVPYVGSGFVSSQMAFDKRTTKQCMIEHGIPTPPFELLNDASELTLDFPVVVKPCLQGSSLGVHVVHHREQWERAFADASKYDSPVLVEAFIPGREFTVAILEDKALPVIEIVAPNGNFDFTAKYTKGTTRYDVPANVNPASAFAMQRIALQFFAALKCSDLSRVDFRMNDDGQLFVLENNTIPGFTATSLVPMAAQAAGISFSELCVRLMCCATLGKY